MTVIRKKNIQRLLPTLLVFCIGCVKAELPKELIGTKPNSWRSETIFTHVIWNDILYYGAGSGSDGGDPRHEMEIGAFHLLSPDSGYHHKKNPVVTREQFGLKKPGKGITPLSIIESGDSLYMYCTSRPDDDLQPHIVLISAHVSDPFTWGNYKTIVDESFSGKKNNHGASAMIDPENKRNVLLYFAARSPEDNYRILLAEVPLAQINSPTSYKLIRDHENPVLYRPDAKTNYPFVRYLPKSEEYELWYSGQTVGDPKTRSCFMTKSRSNDSFEPSKKMIVQASGIENRNDNAYATVPKVHDNYLYYSGRKNANGNYKAIFCTELKHLE